MKNRLRSVEDELMNVETTLANAGPTPISGQIHMKGLGQIIQLLISPQLGRNYDEGKLCWVANCPLDNNQVCQSSTARKVEPQTLLRIKAKLG